MTSLTNNQTPDTPLTRIRLRPGAFLDDPPAEVADLHLKRLEAAIPSIGAGSYFNLASAALIHGLPVFHADLNRVHVVHTDGGHGNITAFTHGYTTPKVPPKTTVLDGVPVTTLARTAADLMRRSLFGPALAIADAALRLGCDRGGLLAEVKGGRGCRHSTEAALRANRLSESPYESLVRARFLQTGIPLPVLQHQFEDALGIIGRSDFYWPQFDLVGEFDGEVKYTTLPSPGETREVVLRRQGVRQGRIEALGNDFVRWVSADVHSPGAIEASLYPYLGDHRVDHGLCPEAHDLRRPRGRRR